MNSIFKGEEGMVKKCVILDAGNTLRLIPMPLMTSSKFGCLFFGTSTLKHGLTDHKFWENCMFFQVMTHLDLTHKLSVRKRTLH